MHSQGSLTEVSEFLEYVKTPRTPTIYNAIRHAKPLSDVVRFGTPESIRRHYEWLSTFPRGLLPIGDAICRFNPIYEQGMTVAAQEACLLRNVLATLAGEARSSGASGPGVFRGRMR
jgi:2-polyprenyl-6-methoxyphenol hydroxylase-like FAD-dependent oxidoreductase